MMNNQTPIEKQFPMIDTIFWNLLESEYYITIPETTGTMESVKKDEDSLMKMVEENGVTGEALKRINNELCEVRTGAAFFGEEKGFILGFIHGVKMATDISKISDLLHIPGISV